MLRETVLSELLGGRQVGGVQVQRVRSPRSWGLSPSLDNTGKLELLEWQDFLACIPKADKRYAGDLVTDFVHVKNNRAIVFTDQRLLYVSLTSNRAIWEIKGSNLSHIHLDGLSLYLTSWERPKLLGHKASGRAPKLPVRHTVYCSSRDSHQALALRAAAFLARHQSLPKASEEAAAARKDKGPRHTLNLIPKPRNPDAEPGLPPASGPGLATNLFSSGAAEMMTPQMGNRTSMEALRDELTAREISLEVSLPGSSTSSQRGVPTRHAWLATQSTFRKQAPGLSSMSNEMTSSRLAAGFNAAASSSADAVPLSSPSASSIAQVRVAAEPTEAAGSSTSTPTGPQQQGRTPADPRRAVILQHLSSLEMLIKLAQAPTTPLQSVAGLLISIGALCDTVAAMLPPEEDAAARAVVTSMRALCEPQGGPGAEDCSRLALGTLSQLCGSVIQLIK